MRNNLLFGIILIGAGVFFLLDNFGIADFGDLVHDYWPLIIIIWGLSIVLRHRSARATVVGSEPGFDKESLHETTAFGNHYSNVSSSSFKGGSVTTIFGNCDLDLTKATFAEGEHLLTISGVFGNTHLMLPKDCAAAITAKVFLGTLTLFGQRKDAMASELTYVTPNYDASPRKLRITISKAFGSAMVI